MGTHCTIALEDKQGQIAQVYCHWDGYLEGAGRILLQHYSDPFKLAMMIAHGNLSSLGPEIGTQHDFDAHDPEICKFYARDRRETLRRNIHAGFAEYQRSTVLEEYNYILRNNGKWYTSRDEGDFIQLEQVMQQESQT